MQEIRKHGHRDILVQEAAAAWLRRRPADSVSETARMIFENAAIEAGVPSDWLVVEGDAEGLIACTRPFDLTVFPMWAADSGGRYDISPAALGLGGGVPALITWNRSREVARAVRDARPVIRSCSDNFARGRGRPRGRPAPTVGSSRLKATLVFKRGDKVPEAGRKQADTAGKNLIVMGLGGRMRKPDRAATRLGRMDRDLSPPVRRPARCPYASHPGSR